MFGHDARLPQELALLPPSRYIIDIEDYKYQLHLNLHQAWSIARATMENAQNMQQHYYNKHAKEKKFNLGDLVMLFSPVIDPTIGKKFHKPWLGPYRIKGLTSKNATIEGITPENKKTEYVTLDRLKHFFTIPNNNNEEKTHLDLEKPANSKIVKRKVKQELVNQPVVQHRYNLRPRGEAKEAKLAHHTKYLPLQIL
jgi:hypothetical protein